MPFQDDIRGKNIQVFPVIRIGDDTFTTDAPDEGHYQYYSTNNVSIVEKWGLGSAKRDVYCKPILMNIPSIKQSVDIESRKFKIGNVTLEFNNFLVDGVRFSDQLSESSLINREVSIYLKTVSTFEIPSGNLNLFYGASEEVDPDDFDRDFLLRVYQGQIRRISHDDEKVKIELEDLTEQKTHRDLPLTEYSDGTKGYLGDGNNIQDKYKNKPIPIVYGEVDKSPCVLESSAEGQNIIPDFRSISEFNEDSPLYIQANNSYLKVKRFLDYTNSSSFGELDIFNDYESPSFSDIQYTVESDSIILTSKSVNGDGISAWGKFNTLLCEYRGSPTSWRIWGLNNGSFISLLTDDDNPSFAIDGDSNTVCVLDDNTIISEWEAPTFDQSYVTTPIMGMVIDSISNSISNHLSQVRTVYINGTAHYFLAFSINDEVITGASVVPRIVLVRTDDIKNEVDGAFGNDPVMIVEDDFFINLDASRHPNDAPIKIDVSGNQTHEVFTLNKTGKNDNTISFTLYAFRGNNGADLGNDIDGEIYGEFNDIEVRVFIFPKEIFKEDFYVNVNGRVNTSDDHPELDNDEFIKNPIDIIYDILRSELGLSETQINEADYIEARDAHSEWEFGFTINKKTGSKKLIEDIAKSTKCFPKFKNDGTFGFNTIKDSYTVIGEDSDYNTATEIKESEVIKYSFKKTKPEQIYKKVDVQYKKDYAQDSFLKRTDTIGDNTDSYYGISEDEAILEFESPYIRHDETADNLRDFIEAQYRNNHLIFNLKLPLQYIELEIGDLVKFRDLFNGVKAYGIDYRAIDEPNGQVYYPLFMITSTKKNLDSVEIECMQLHHLSGSIEGDLDANTGWYDYNGLFNFPDHTPVIATQVDEEIDTDDFIAYSGDDIQISGNVTSVYGSQISVGVIDDYDYSGLLGDANHFTVEGLDFEPQPEFGLDNIVMITHLYNENSEYQNSFTIRSKQEIDHDGDGIADDLNIIPSNFTVEEGQQVTFTLSSYTVPEESESTPIGNVNFDSVVNILDVVLLVSFIMGTQEPTDEQEFEGDINGDGGINVLDIVHVVDRIIEG